jgi:hypothetical protein
VVEEKEGEEKKKKDAGTTGRGCHLSPLSLLQHSAVFSTTYSILGAVTSPKNLTPPLSLV